MNKIIKKENTTKVKKKWYKNGLLESETNYDNRKFHGINQGLYIDGQIWYKYHYNNNKEHGMFQLWHENGQLKSEMPYVNGVEHGYIREWCDKGQMLFECLYIDGKKHRISKLTDRYFIFGQEYLENDYKNIIRKTKDNIQILNLNEINLYDVIFNYIM